MAIFRIITGILGRFTGTFYGSALPDDARKSGSVQANILPDYQPVMPCQAGIR